MAKKWRIRYEDRSIFDSNDGNPEEAPSTGIVTITQPDIMLGRAILFNWPCYWYEGTVADGEWIRATFEGLMAQLRVDATKVRAYKEGVYPRQGLLKTIWDESFDDLDAELPTKFARDGYESPYHRQPDFILDRLPNDPDLTPIPPT